MYIPWYAPEKQLSLEVLQTSESAILLYLQLTNLYVFCPKRGERNDCSNSFGELLFR